MHGEDRRDRLCMGGGFALLCSPRYDFQAASVNYGEVPKEAAERLAGACPIVASYGQRDRGLQRRAQRLESVAHPSTTSRSTRAPGTAS